MTVDLDAIEARATAATPVVRVTSDGRVWCVLATAFEQGERVLLTLNTHFPHVDDAAFLLAARADVLALAARVRELEAARTPLAPPAAPVAPCRAMTLATTYPALVGATLASVRRRSLATVADLAAAMHMTAGAWRSVERGGVRLSIELLARFGEFAGADPSEFLARAGRARLALEAQGVYVSSRGITARVAFGEGLTLLDAEALAEAVALAEASP